MIRAGDASEMTGRPRANTTVYLQGVLYWIEALAPEDAVFLVPWLLETAQCAGKFGEKTHEERCLRRATDRPATWHRRPHQIAGADIPGSSDRSTAGCEGRRKSALDVERNVWVRAATRHRVSRRATRLWFCDGPPLRRP